MHVARSSAAEIIATAQQQRQTGSVHPQQRPSFLVQDSLCASLDSVSWSYNPRIGERHAKQRRLSASRRYLTPGFYSKITSVPLYLLEKGKTQHKKRLTENEMVIFTTASSRSVTLTSQNNHPIIRGLQIL